MSHKRFSDMEDGTIKHKMSMISSEKLCNSEWIEEKSQINAVINDVILGKPDEGQLHCYWI